MKMLKFKKFSAALLCFIIIIIAAFGQSVFAEGIDGIAPSFEGWESDNIGIYTDSETNTKMVGLSAGAAYGSSMVSKEFEIGDFDRFAVMFRVKANPKLTDTVYNTYFVSAPIGIYLINASTGDIIADYQDFGAITANTAMGGWSNHFALQAYPQGDAVYAIMLKQQITNSTLASACEGESPYWLKDFRVVGYNDDGTYTDLYTMETLYKYGQVAGGTAQNGVEMVYAENTAVYPGMYGDPNRAVEYPATCGFINNDFSMGFKYWALKNDSYGKTTDDKSVTVTKLSDVVYLNENVLTFRSFAASQNQNLGIQSMPFSLSEYTEAGDKVYFTVDHLNSNYCRIKVYSENGDSLKDNIKASSWKTTQLNPITVSNVNATYAFEIQSYKNIGGAKFKNIQVLRNDRGGLEKAPLVNINGKLLKGNYYGDAGGDNYVDLTDIVRMKKYMSFAASNTRVPIFFSAADINSNGIIDAEDASFVINYLLKGTVIPGNDGITIVRPDGSDDGFVELPDIEF